MNLEIKNIFSAEMGRGEEPEDLYNFTMLIAVEIGEKGKDGGETFYFVAASPSGLKDGVREGEFKLLRGYILIEKFSWKVIHRAIENIINHIRGYRDNSWNEAIDFISRNGIYEAEDIHE